MVWWCLSGSASGSPSIRPSVSHSFPHFSPTCFDILSSNFLCHFLLMNIWSSSNVVNFRQFLLELFWTLEYWKHTVFRIFLLHALTYWAEIFHLTLFYCTTDQVWVSSICLNFCGSYAPFGTYNTGNIHYCALFWLTCFDILSWNFTFDFVFLYYRSSLNFCRSNAPFGT